MGEQEPGHDDALAAILVRNVVEMSPLTDGRQAVRVSFLLRSRKPVVPPYFTPPWVDRSFFFDCLTGEAFTGLRHLLSMGANSAAIDASIYPSDWLEGITNFDELVGVRGPESGGRGWWERMVGDYSQLLAWLLTYMTAKGIVIVEEPLSRQQRRALGRMKHRPSPWHIVTVDPTLISDAESGGSGRHPSFRYDVRGHLRFGRHPRADGTYTERAEWVRPHQRGLANAIYVPKTYLYDAKSPKVDGLDGT